MLLRAGTSLVVAVLAMTVGGCRAPETREAPWNVLLVTFDTTRADRIGCYGNERIQTPVLDRLAAEGVRFARTLSAVPITAPSHSTILTGRYPIAHGVRDNGVFSLGEEQITLAEILAGEGYQTAAAVGAFPLTARFGLNQGFDLFDDHLTGRFEDYLGNRVAPKERLFFDERRAAQVNDAIVPWLSQHAAEPFFAWVHYFDPHQPFEPAAPYDQLYADSLYDGEIAYADSRLGFLIDHLESLGVLDRTLVVMTADHGEGLGDHNELTHAVLAYNSTLHVPLIVRPPQGVVTPGTVVEEWVGTVDILPTILDLLDLSPPPGIQGQSLRPLWHGESPDTRLRYAENLSPSVTHGWGEQRVLLEAPLKYIHGPRPELYDLDADPEELRNLIDERPEDASRLRSQLADFLAREAVAGVSAPEEIDEDVRQRLEALGYLHSTGNAGEEISETLRDGGIAPQERVGDLNKLSAAKHLLFQGRPRDALTYTEELVALAPDSPLYVELHAAALAEVGRLEEATRAARQLAELGSVPEPLILRLTELRFADGDEQGAVSALREWVAETPSARSLWILSWLEQRAGDAERSRASLEAALETDPAFAPARVDLAVKLARDGDVMAAESEFLRTLSDAPYFAKGHYNYGTFLLQYGRPDEAVARFERALALSPGYLRARLGLVAALLDSSRPEQARAAADELRSLAPNSPEVSTAQELLAEAVR